MTTENSPTNYVTVRLTVVHVRKKWGFFREKVIGHQICIPDTWEDADKLVGQIADLMRKYGVQYIIPIQLSESGEK